MKLYISKKITDDGKSNYYTTLKNNYKGVNSKCYISIQLPKDKEVEYGFHHVDFFFSCYTTKSGVKPKIIITKFLDQPKKI